MSLPRPKPKMGEKIDPGHPMSQNLLALYPFVDRSGATLTDFSGNGHHGIVTNLGSNPWSLEKGGALLFNGAGYVDLGAISASLGSGDFTLIVELYVDESVFPNKHILTSGELGNTVNGIAVNTLNIGSTDAYYIKEGGTSLRNETATNSGLLKTWQRLLITRNNTTTTRDMSLYLDGILSASYSPSDLNAIDLSSPGDFWLGSMIWNAASLFKGRISEVRLYDRGFSPSDILADSIDPWALFPPPLRQRNNARISQLSDRIRRRLLTERGSFVYNPALGSEIHLLTRAKNLEEVYAFAEVEVRSALRPEIQKGHILDISGIRVKEKTLYTVSLEIDILANNQDLITLPLLIS